MQGGATKDIPMNAYILITLLETTEYQVDGHQQAIQSLANNLKQWIDSDAEKDPYSLAVLLYGMSLLEDDDYFQKIYEELDHKSTKEGGMQYWKMKEVGSHFRSSTDENGNVEISSYVLLAYTKQALLRDGIPIMRWLVSQRNSMGGYHSTQDTVVSLEALSKFASLQGWSSKMKVDVTAFNSLDYSYSFPTITRDISTMLISHTFPSESRNLTLTARGNGTALLQVAWQYNLNNSHIKKHLRLKIVDNSTDKDRMAIQACASWKGQQKSGMVLIEIGIPSGFAPDTDNLDEIDLIRKTEFEGRNLVIYLEEYLFWEHIKPTVVRCVHLLILAEKFLV
ncbi:CD109 [Acanthosepion pharaonis]|uniref:CD109 n=1 Tax=Acanthosepion pharaonis TaxID=158019 RepID=A0A812C289_ACAPH|nr:CD109 [Sepia pharaonis]